MNIAFRAYQNSVFSGIKEVYCFLAALCIYALFSIPTAVILLGVEKTEAFFRTNMRLPLPELSRMDMLLMLGVSLLVFKWTASLLPFIFETDYLPKTPYLVIIPCIGVYLLLVRWLKKKQLQYKIQWCCLTAGSVFLSKRSYDLFIISDSSKVIKALILIFLAGVCLAAGLMLSFLMERVIIRPKLYKKAFSSIVVLCMMIGCILLFDVQPKSDYMAAPVNGPSSSILRRPVVEKNVILIVVDCLRADHLASFGYHRQTSPFLDKFANNNIKFLNCVSASSWTIPSVVSLFTGVYPQQHGINKFGGIIPEELESMHEVMETAGYETAAFITNDFLLPRLGYSRGVRYYRDTYLQPGLKDFLASNLFFLNAYLYFKNEIFHPFSVDTFGSRWWSIGTPPFNHKKRSAEQVTDNVLEWIEMKHNRPFYIYIHYMDVHGPYDTYWYPLYDENNYGVQDVREKLINVYDGRILYLDQHIKRIWETLTALNLTDKTMFIVTSDHGEEFFDHLGTGHNTTLYDELIRLPIIMHVPDVNEDSITIERQVKSIDIPVTILDFLDIEVPAHMLGESLLPYAKGIKNMSSPAYALSYTGDGRKSLKTREGQDLWNKKNWSSGIKISSLRVDNEWKVILYSDGRKELFNLKKDKAELYNLRENFAPFATLQEKLKAIEADLRVYVPHEDTEAISSDMKKRLKALGYLSNED